MPNLPPTPIKPIIGFMIAKLENVSANHAAALTV